MISNLMDRWSENFLLTLGAIKLTLVAAFFLSFAALPAQMANAASDVTCTGVNLLEKLKAEEPEKFTKLTEEAALVANGDSIFWKIEKDGQPVSWLFGTMHMADPEISTLPEDVAQTLDSVDRVIIETLDVLDQQATAKAMAKVQHLVLLQNGQTLRSLVQDDLEDKLKTAVSARGVPIELADRMQPWLIATMISLPVCELQRKQTGESVLDQVIAQKAKEQGKILAGLETMEEQFLAMSSLPQAFHVNALEETLAMGNGATDIIATMVALYKKGQTGMVFPMMRAMSPESYSGDGAVQFQQALIDKRNDTMLERALPMLEVNSTLLAIGALHLPGETGLVRQLRSAGYQVTKVR